MGDKEAKPRPKKQLPCPHCGCPLYLDFDRTTRGTAIGPATGLVCERLNCRGHVIPLQGLSKNWQEYVSQFSKGYGGELECNGKYVHVYNGEHIIVSDPPHNGARQRWGLQEE